MERKLCPKCESNHWMQNLPIGSDDGSAPHIYMGMTWLGIAVAASKMQASVCGDCGYTELYAENHAEMLEEWRKRNA